MTLRRNLADVLSAGQSAGTIRPDVDPDQLATGLETVVLALLIAALQTGGVNDVDRVVGVRELLDASLHVPVHGAPG